MARPGSGRAPSGLDDPSAAQGAAADMGEAAPLQEWLERYLAHLRDERRLSPLTLAAYRRDLQQLCSWLETQGIATWNRLDGPQVRGYLAQRHRGGLGSRSLQRELAALRSLFRYLLREGVVNGNPAQGVRIAAKMDRTVRLHDGVLA
jgi:integrase/recombinase XerC